MAAVVAHGPAASRPRAARLAAITNEKIDDLRVVGGYLYWTSSEKLVKKIPINGEWHGYETVLHRIPKTGGSVERVAGIEGDHGSLVAMDERTAYLSMPPGPHFRPTIVYAVDLQARPARPREVLRSRGVSKGAIVSGKLFIVTHETHATRGGLTHLERVDRRGNVVRVRTLSEGTTETFFGLSRYRDGLLATGSDGQSFLSLQGRRTPLDERGHDVKALADRRAFVQRIGEQTELVSTSFPDRRLTVHDSIVSPKALPTSYTSQAFAGNVLSERGIIWVVQDIEADVLYSPQFMCSSCVTRWTPRKMEIKAQSWAGNPISITTGKHIGAYAADDQYVYWFDTKAKELLRVAW